MSDAEPGLPAPLAGIPRERWPRHVAVIMDGNGRWAQARGLPRAAGHREGVATVRRIEPALVDEAEDAQDGVAALGDDEVQPAVRLEVLPAKQRLVAGEHVARSPVLLDESADRRDVVGAGDPVRGRTGSRHVV